MSLRLIFLIIFKNFQIHFCSLSGDSGKSGYLNMLCSIFVVDDNDPSSEHLCLEVSPEAFGTHGMSEMAMLKKCHYFKAHMSFITIFRSIQ